MARIKLIVTGDVERLALHESIKRLFGTYRQNPAGGLQEEVLWDEPRMVKSVTSYRLKKGGVPSKQMTDLALAMLDEALIGKEGKPADLVVVVDDVELANIGQEDVVAEHFDGMFYAETTHGLQALREMDWTSVPKGAMEVAIVRAMLEDLADWFWVPNPIGKGALHPQFYPGRAIDRSTLLLRNM